MRGQSLRRRHNVSSISLPASPIFPANLIESELTLHLYRTPWTIDYHCSTSNIDLRTPEMQDGLSCLELLGNEAGVPRSLEVIRSHSKTHRAFCGLSGDALTIDHLWASVRSYCDFGR